MATAEASAIDFFTDRSLIEDPFHYYEQLRRQGPVWREPVHGAYVVTGYDELCAVYRDSNTFSSVNAFGGPIPGLPEQVNGDDASELIAKFRHLFPGSETLSAFDPPEHTAHRGLMMRLLTPKRLQENEAFMWRLADRVIDEFDDLTSCEFVADYAQPFALLVIAGLLGIPESDQRALRQEFVAVGQPGRLGEKLRDDPFAFLEAWFTGYVEDRRAHPRDDVLTQMAQATFPDGSTPTVLQVVRAATFLFAAGQGTSARFLGNMIQLIAEQPQLQHTLRRHRDRIPAFVEEALRMCGPVKVNFRMARTRTHLAGVDIPAGSTVMLLVQAANRDPGHFDDPARFDQERPNVREHVAFGRGVHSCPGGPLVRADAKITLERLLDRFREISISAAHHGSASERRYDYTPSWILRGLDALHLDLRPAT